MDSRIIDLDARLEPILRLLRRHDMVRALAQRESAHKPELVDSLVERQYQNELARRWAWWPLSSMAMPRWAWS